MLEVVPRHLLVCKINVDTINSAKSFKEQMNIYLCLAVIVFNSALYIAGSWFLYGWGHLTQEQGGSVMVGATRCIPHIFGNPYMTVLPACWQIRKEGRKLSLGRRSRTQGPVFLQ